MEMVLNRYSIIHLIKQRKQNGVVSNGSRPEHIFDIALYRKASNKGGAMHV